jgi:membrane protein required for colicin V production
MNWADWVILAILVVSSLISLKRGFVREALSLVNWFIAFFIAMSFHAALAGLLQAYIGAPSLREMVAFASLFALTLIVGAMVNNLLVELVRMTGLGGTDKTFGMIFGLLRGFIIVMAILILVPPFVPIDQDGWWQQSMLIPELLKLEGWCRLMVSELSTLISGLFN